MTTMTMTTITKCSVFALTASVLACELPIDQLEVGDAMDGTDADTGTDSSGDGDGDGDDGDGDGETSLECVVQGTNLGGDDEPIDFPLPECEVECASGWGHGADLLGSEWTLDLEHAGPNTGFTYLDATPTGELVAVIGHADAAARLVWISAEGELQDELEQSAIDGDVWGVGIDDYGTIHAIWRDGDMQSVTALSSDGEHLWTVALGPYEGQHSVLSALDAGTMVVLNSADPNASRLVRLDVNGEVLDLGSIPHAFEISVAPGGQTVAVANTTTIFWTDFALFPTGTRTQGVADVSFVFGLVALDDERVATVGVADNWNEGGSPHAYVKQIGSMGLEWEGRYDRASSWCPGQSEGQPSPTQEHMYDVERLADGTLLLVGAENGGYGNGRDLGQEGSDQLMQPWVGHVSAQGEVLAMDRGFWHGSAAAVARSQDAAYVLLFEFDDAQQQHMYVRKYVL